MILAILNSLIQAIRNAVQHGAGLQVQANGLVIAGRDPPVRNASATIRLGIAQDVFGSCKLT